MKILITGAKGQLGRELLRQLENGSSALGPLPEALKGAEAVGVDLADADLSSLSAVQALLAQHVPDVVINCAAFTNVDACETQPDDAFKGNAVAPRNLAIVCEQREIRLIHVSTDYVLSGEGDSPFAETALPAPQSVYGKTKLLGETYVESLCTRWMVVRTAWLYGKEGGNFVKTILRVAKEKGAAKVVDDQLGNPTNAEDLAHHLLKLSATEQYGLYHCTGEGTCSWYDLAAEAVRLAGIDAEISPCTTEEFPRPAKRPAYSSLDNAMLRATVGDEMRPWQEALRAYLVENSLESLIG